MMFDDEVNMPNSCNNLDFQKGSTVLVQNEEVVVIEGAKKLLEFSKERVRLKMGKHKCLNVGGANMCILEFDFACIKLGGKVAKIEFEDV